jgi:hypothetical protein
MTENTTVDNPNPTNEVKQMADATEPVVPEVVQETPKVKQADDLTTVLQELDAVWKALVTAWKNIIKAYGKEPEKYPYPYPSPVSQSDERLAEAQATIKKLQQALLDTKVAVLKEKFPGADLSFVASDKPLDVKLAVADELIANASKIVQPKQAAPEKKIEVPSEPDAKRKIRSMLKSMGYPEDFLDLGD